MFLAFFPSFLLSSFLSSPSPSLFLFIYFLFQQSLSLLLSFSSPPPFCLGNKTLSLFLSHALLAKILAVIFDSSISQHPSFSLYTLLVLNEFIIPLFLKFLLCTPLIQTIIIYCIITIAYQTNCIEFCRFSRHQCCELIKSSFGLCFLHMF